MKKVTYKIEQFKSITIEVETEEQEINPPVKMRLERSAERDKREIINNLSLNHAQSNAEGILNRFTVS